MVHATCFYLRVVCAVLKCFAFEFACAYDLLWNGTPYTTISIATLILQDEILLLARTIIPDYERKGKNILL